jgi:glycosyltransferase involved in cell wall biosynthesis
VEYVEYRVLNRMKKVLIITYYWPPSGGAAVQRWLSMANKLSEAGLEVFVLTVQEKSATYQLIDFSLESSVHPEIRVYKTKTSEPFNLFLSIFGKNKLPKPAFSGETNTGFFQKILRFVRGNFFSPDPRKGWKKFAVPKALEIIRKEEILNVITAGPPHSTHFIGEEIKKQIPKIFWITDFHDLWTDVIYYDQLYHLPWIKKREKLLEQRILEHSDLIFTVGDKYKAKLLAKTGIPNEKIKIIRIGYDDSLFSDLELNEEPQQEFVITYTGTIGDIYQPQIFFKALKNVLNQNSDLVVKLLIAGVVSPGVISEIEKAGLKNNFHFLGYISHPESVKLLKKSNLLLLVNPAVKDEEMVIPGKVYEYLAARKPIINITKATAETAYLIDSCNAGRTFDRHMQNELEDFLRKCIKEWSNKIPCNIYNEQKLHTFSITHISQEVISSLC